MLVMDKLAPIFSNCLNLLRHWRMWGAALGLSLAGLLPSAAVAQVALVNPSFESPVIAEGLSITPLPADHGWTVRGSVELRNGALVANASPYLIDIPMGRQMIRMRAGSAISQSVTIATPGTYSIAVQAAYPPGMSSGQTLRASLNGAAAAVQTPGATMAQATFAGFTIATAGTYTLQIDLPDPPASPTVTDGLWLDNVVLYRTDGGANALPAAGINYPINLQSYPDYNIEVAATAIDPEGVINKVELYEGTAAGSLTLVSALTAPPWKWARSYGTNGSKYLKVKVYDGLNQTTDSDTIQIFHTAGTAKPFVMNGSFENPRLPVATGGYGYNNTPYNWGGFDPYGSLGIGAAGFTTPQSSALIQPLFGRQSAFLDATTYSQIMNHWVTLPAGAYGLTFRASPGSIGLQVAGADINTIVYGAANQFALPFNAAGGAGQFTFRAGTTAYGTIIHLDDVKIGPAGAPIVTIATVPSTTFTAPASIRVLANIEVYSRTITQTQLVDVTSGSDVAISGLGSVGTATAIGMDWIVLQPGTYTIKLKVTDSTNAVTYSAPLTVTVNAPTQPAFFNPGFEHNMPWGGNIWSSLTGWSVTGCTYCAVLSARGSSFFPTATAVPEGIAVGMVKTGAAMTQSVYFPAGNYKIGFKAAQMPVNPGQPGGTAAFQVFVNGALVGTFTPTATFTDYLTAQFTVAASGMQTVKFESTTPGNTVYAGFDALTIQVPNNAPTVALTAPANGATYALGTAINLSATAADSDGSIAKVEFFDGATLIGTVTNPSSGAYPFTWINAVAGSHAVTAKATDNLGASTVSAVLSVVVTNAVEVSMTTASGQVFSTQAPVPLKALATSAMNLPVADVKFLKAGVPIGTAVYDPVTKQALLLWAGAPAGTHQIAAKATNAQNGTATSAAITIDVSPTAPLATFAGNISVSGTAQVNSTLTLSATVNNPGGGPVDLTFIAGGEFAQPTQSGNTWNAAWTPTREGSYLVKARISGNGGQEVISVTNVLVAATPAATPITIPTATSNAGAMAGTFNVSDMGAAQYSIPIAVPPGTGGMQPSLALSYSSQGGAGHVGMGMSLSGLSYITRCPKTVAQDGYKEGINYDKNVNNDVFCLDGQRLIPVAQRPGNDPEWGPIKIIEYRTEIDRFERIEGYEVNSQQVVGGISNFRVFTKSGLVMDYGLRWWGINNGWIQQALDQERVNTVKVWPLDRVADRNKNYMVIDYSGTNAFMSAPVRQPTTAALIAPVGSFPPAELYPVQITYTLNETVAAGITKVHRVLFEYEDRPTNDQHVYFDSGAGQMLLTKRLKTIKTFVDGSRVGNAADPFLYALGYPYELCTLQGKCGQLARRYELQYESGPTTDRSRVVSVQECEQGGVCLQPTQFVWSNGTNAQGIGDLLGRESAHYPANGDAFGEFQVADIDGDGRSDLARRYGADGYVRALLSRPGGTGWEEKTLRDLTTGLHPNDPWGFADFNGDGRADFWATSNNGGPDRYFKICMNKLATAQTEADSLSCTGYNGPANSSTNPMIGGMVDGFFLQGDFNGDGKIDLLLYRGTNGQFRDWDLYFGTDALGPDKGVNPSPRRVKTRFTQGFVGSLEKYVGVGDFNGDGRADIISRVTRGECTMGDIDPETELCTKPDVSWNIDFSRGELDQGNGNVFDVDVNAPYVIGTNGTVDRSVIYDFNGDGLADLLAPANNNGKYDKINLCLSAGDGSFASEFVVSSGYPGYIAGSLCKTISLPPPFGDREKHQIGFGDFNGDGRTDIITVADYVPATTTEPEKSQRYHVCLATNGSTPSGPAKNVVDFKCEIWSTKMLAEGIDIGIDKLRLGDFNGDGKTDLAFGSAGFVKKNTSSDMLPDMVTKITNGIGAFTALEYAPITTTDAYTKGTLTNNCTTSPLVECAKKLDIQSPLYIVKRTLSSNGVPCTPTPQPGLPYGDCTFNTDYSYAGLLGQRDGRGLLGFARKSTQHSNGAATVRTDMVFDQDFWWKAGRVKSVEKYINNKLVNRASNEFAYKSYPGNAAVYQVHSVKTKEESWNLDDATETTTALPYTVTETPIANIDQFGNVGKVIATTYEPNGTADGYSKTTDNSYLPAVIDTNNLKWIVDRLIQATVTHKSPTDTAGKTRTSTFDYDAATGQLLVERIEPVSGDASLPLTTTYGYDTYGNTTSVTASFSDNGQAKTRSTTTTYHPEGRFISTITNKLGHVETRHLYDSRFGIATRTTDANGLRVDTAVDGFGRKVGESLYAGIGDNQPLIARTTMSYAATSNGVANNGWSVTTSTNTASVTSKFYDSLNRPITEYARTFSGNNSLSLMYYDKFGRKQSTSQPHGGAIEGAGGSVVDKYQTTTFEYDKLGRVKAQVLRDGGNENSPEYARTTTQYGVVSDGGTRMKTAVTQTNPGYTSHTVTKLSDSQGRTVKMIDNSNSSGTLNGVGTTSYGYDAIGNLTQVTGPGSISETMTYDLRGRKKTASNANVGGNYTYTYNGAGDLIRQTDPKGQVTTQVFDDLGRMVSRDESGHATTWTYDCTYARGKLCTVANSGAVYAGASHTTNYDIYSRPIQVLSVIDGKTYVRTTLYNNEGQVSFVGYPDAEYPGGSIFQGAAVRYKYQYGFLEQVLRGDLGDINFMKVLARYSDGSLAKATQGSNPVERDYDFLGRPIAARLKNSDGSATLQASAYGYDALGNVRSRGQTGSQTWAESFSYDALNRVETVSSSSAGIGSKTFTYSTDGNLTGKYAGASTANLALGLPGAISYGNGSGGRNPTTGAGPHAVASANVGPSGAARSFSYDANGNYTGYSDGSRTITYTPFNLPIRITGSNVQIPDAGSANSLDYVYDGDHARVKEISVTGVGTTTTTYVGNSFYEKVLNPDGSTEHRNYLTGPDGILGVWTLADVGGGTRYWYKDHLGSPILEFGGGPADVNMGFDAWGLRRPGNHLDAGVVTANELSTSGNANSHWTHRGFTGHQHLDGLGLIHMNGRLYDPVVGRFLQADPVIQEPYNSQNFNRYTYVLNNPLAYTDPTGYSFWTEVRRPVAAIVVAYLTYNAAYAYQTAGLFEYYTAAEVAAIKATSAVISGFAAGGVGGGNIESAITGAITGGVLDWVGAQAFALPEKALAHAVAGCIGAGINGDCGRNALAGGFSALAGAGLEIKGWDNMATRALVGGLAASVAGGKFANGAFTAAFNFLLNDDKHDSPEENNVGERSNTNADLIVSKVLKGATETLVPFAGCVTEGCGAGGLAIAAVTSTPPGKILKVAPLAKTATEAASELAKKLGRNRVSGRTAGGKQVDIDLAGKGHFDKATGKVVETPHVHTSDLHVGPNGKVSASNTTVREANMADVRTARKLGER